MELGGEIITGNADGTFSLSVTFVLAADEFKNTPHLSLTAKGEQELFENITTIEYGLTCPIYGDGREGDYKLKTQAQDHYNLSQVMNRIELTKIFTVSIDDKNILADQAMKDIASVFEEEVIPAFSGPDDAPKLARLPAVKR